MKIYLISGFVLVVIIFLIIVFQIFLVYIQKKQEKKINKLKKTLLRIRGNKENEKTAKVAEYIFTALESVKNQESFFYQILNKKALHFSFEITNIEKHIYFYVWCPEKYKNVLISQIYAHYPDSEIEEVKDYTTQITKKRAENSVCAEMENYNYDFLPIKRATQFEDPNTKVFIDPLSSITSSLNNLDSPHDQFWLQINIRPIDKTWSKKVLKILEKEFRISSDKFKDWYIKKSLDRENYNFFFKFFLKPWLNLIFLKNSEEKSLKLSQVIIEKHDTEDETNAILNKISQQSFETSIRAVYLPYKLDTSLAVYKIKEILTSFNQFNIPRFNGFKIKKIISNKILALKRYHQRKIFDPFILNTEELATLWHLPHFGVTTPNIQWVLSKKLQAPLNLPIVNKQNQDITALGETNFRGFRQKFGIKIDDRRRHIYIIGKTGMGKSTILENMIASDIENNKGLAVIDPHGDLAEAVLNFIPKSRTNQVMVFDPSDRDFPVSFNMLECRTPEQRHLVASGLLGVFKKMFGDSWGPRLEHILRNTILALTETPGSTILGIMKMLTDDKYRQKIVANVKDEMVLSFWNDEFGKWQPRQKVEAVSPIQNKVGQFLSSSLVRNVFGQPKSSVDLRFAMDKQKIVIVNLSKGKIGEDNSSLLGSMFITKFQIDAMSRADTKQEERQDFYLYVDEFQNFATDSFATILSEARKYKLNLTMANQYIDQMSDEVKAAVFGNVGSMIVGQVGAEDAEIFEKQFSLQVSANDIINLPKYKSYIKLMIDGMSSQVFSSDNLYPPDKSYLKLADKDTIIKLSRERYAKKREFVEEKIGQWFNK